MRRVVSCMGLDLVESYAEENARVLRSKPSEDKSVPLMLG